MNVAVSIWEKHGPRFRWIQEHVDAISIGDLSVALGHYATKSHNYKKFSFHFQVLSRIHEN